MTVEIAKLMEDLVYSLEEGRVTFNGRDSEFIKSLSTRKSSGQTLTDKQVRAAEVVWDKRLRGLEDFTKWDTNNAIMFDGKLYAGILDKLAALFVDIDDEDNDYSEWETTFLEDVYTKYHPDSYGEKHTPDMFNPILSGKQIETIERVHEHAFE